MRHFSIPCYVLENGFNPRICKRCDKVMAFSIFPSCFNPRICKRCDGVMYNLCCILGVSIHASVKDATTAGFVRNITVQVSIHASVKDATIRLPLMWFIVLSFNPRICKRCDLAAPALASAITVSIHASVKDATPIPC